MRLASRASILSIVACASSLALGLVPMPAAAQTPACTAPANASRLDHPLRRVAQRIAAKQPIIIVAIGSSSTAGAGASSSSASYPSRLEIELKERFAHLTVKVLNRGIGGEEVAEMLARFDKSVLAEQPDLVVWQLGTNTVIRHHRIRPVGGLLAEGIERIKDSGADIVLMDPQFAPKVIAEPNAERMVDLIEIFAKAENVSVFHRFDVMRHWRETRQIPFETFLSPDGLHMNDWGYACVAKLLAAAIDDAATRATAVAGARSRL